MYCKNYWFYWFYLYCFVNIHLIFFQCIPSLPIPSHLVPSTFFPSFPILSHLTPSYHILFCSFLFHFIPHCPISPYFFLLMYSNVLLLFISTLTCSLSSQLSSAVEPFPNSQSFTFLFDHFSSSSSFCPSHNFLISLLIWIFSLYINFSLFLWSASWVIGDGTSKPAKLKVMVVITFCLWVRSLGQDAHCFIAFYVLNSDSLTAFFGLLVFLHCQH